MDRNYIAAIVSTFLETGEPVDVAGVQGLTDYDAIGCYEAGTDAVGEGYLVALDRNGNGIEIDDHYDERVPGMRLRPTAKGFFAVLGPR